MIIQNDNLTIRQENTLIELDNIQVRQGKTTIRLQTSVNLNKGLSVDFYVNGIQKVSIYDCIDSHATMRWKLRNIYTIKNDDKRTHIIKLIQSFNN